MTFFSSVVRLSRGASPRFSSGPRQPLADQSFKPKMLGVLALEGARPSWQAAQLSDLTRDFPRTTSPEGNSDGSGVCSPVDALVR